VAPPCWSKEITAPAADPSKADDSIIDISALLGGFQRRIVSQDFKGGEVTAIMGGVELDLRQASITSGDAVINVFAMCGGITIKVPPDWSVVLQGTPILGGFDERTNAPHDSTKRLVIKGYAIMGGLDVKN
jgi:predicted membrane protein